MYAVLITFERWAATGAVNTMLHRNIVDTLPLKLHRFPFSVIQPLCSFAENDDNYYPTAPLDTHET